MSETQHFEVPQEIKDLFAEGTALKDLRDCYIKRPFGFKKAKNCTIAYQKADNKAWNMVKDLYPALFGKRLSYSNETHELTVKKETKA